MLSIYWIRELQERCALFSPQQNYIKDLQMLNLWKQQRISQQTRSYFWNFVKYRLGQYTKVIQKFGELKKKKKTKINPFICQTIKAFPSVTMNTLDISHNYSTRKYRTSSYQCFPTFEETFIYYITRSYLLRM